MPILKEIGKLNFLELFMANSIVIIIIILGIVSGLIHLLSHPATLFAILILGGIGYALGSIVPSDWSIFGAFVGAVIGLNVTNE